MFIFEKCSYDELQKIRHKENLLLSGWALLEKEYIDETEKIYDEDGTMVALINYYFLNESKKRMMIALFEVFNPYRNRGLGKKIIAYFLKDYYGEVHLEPSGEESESFWKQCGFESGCYLDRRGK
ncbi:MAG: GNAT family N-acetyltransferase [Clostridiales bacterium]|nr:GNAT family N-acetyltransferase [Clostridiales bacterium]